MTTFSQVCTQLNLTGLQLLALMSNPQFPAPSSGNGLSSTWASGINAFATTWNSAKSNGWQLPTAILASANFTAMAAAAPGKYYANLAGTDLLFDA